MVTLLPSARFSPFPALLVFRVDSASGSAPTSMSCALLLSILVADTRLWGSCQPSFSCACTLQRISALLHASWVQEDSTGVRPPNVPHRGAWHARSLSTSFCQLPEPHSAFLWSGQTNTVMGKITERVLCARQLWHTSKYNFSSKVLSTLAPK